MHDIHIIGGGLAGSEAAWQLASKGFKVRLSEMRGSGTMTPAHQTHGLAELVCSNSFRSDDAQNNAVGLLHQEMRDLGSLIMAEGDKHKVPAGSALAVDRDGFSAGVTAALAAHPNIEIVRERVDRLPETRADDRRHRPPHRPGARPRASAHATGKDQLAFFRCDRADRAPREHRHGDRLVPVALGQGRSRGHGQGLYQLPDDQGPVSCLPCGHCSPAEKTEFREWENVPYFEGCMPIEVMAERGVETLRFGPMKGVGLDDPGPGAGPMRWFSCGGTTPRARCGTWSASRRS